MITTKYSSIIMIHRVSQVHLKTLQPVDIAEELVAPEELVAAEELVAVEELIVAKELVAA